MAPRPFVDQTPGHTAELRATSKTQTAVFFHRQLTEKLLPNVADPLLDLVSTLKKKKKKGVC